MHPRIRQIVDNSYFIRSTVEEVASLLPEDDGVLDGWIAGAIAAKDSELVIHLVVAAMHGERAIESRILDGGLCLLADPYWTGMAILRARGDDVPERIHAAFRDTTISRKSKAAALYIAGKWCAEHRDGQYSAALLTEARLLALKPEKLDAHSFGYLAALAQLVGDQRIIDHLIPDTPELENRESVLEASVEVANIFFADCRGPAFNFVREQPELKLSGFTVRRSVDHIGRNEPCPCGSGRKYKRCCFEKDAERLQRSTDVAGKTYAELRVNLEEHLDKKRLAKITIAELRLLDPLKLDPGLLHDYFKRLFRAQLWDEFANALEAVGWSAEIDRLWGEAAVRITRLGRKDLIERLLAARRAVVDPPFDEPPPDYIRLLLVRDEPLEFLKMLETITTESAGMEGSHCPFETAMAVLFSSLPALGILLGRGVIPYATRQHASILLDEMLIAREKLGLPPDEPASDWFDRRFADEKAANGAKETAKLREARQKLQDKAGEVNRMKSDMEKLRAEIERREKKAAENAAKPKPAPAAPVDVEVLRDLREKVSTLKSELKERHEERAVLRRELNTTLNEVETLRENQSHAHGSHADHEDNDDHLVLPGAIESSQPVRLIEFPKKFHHTLGHFPRQIARGTMTLLGRLAAGEPDAFQGIVRLKQRPDTLRARIGIDHRLLFRLESETIHVVDLIPRQDLERRIKSL